MIKVFFGFLLAVVFLVSGVSVFAEAGDSAPVVLTHIQAGGSGAATQEFIALYNNTTEDVDMTGWCLKNKNNVTIACITAAVGQALYVPPQQYAVAVSTSMASLVPADTPTVVFAPISQSSGSIIGSADTISLIDHTGTVIDRHSWTTSITGGSRFVRQVDTVNAAIYRDTDALSDWTIVTSSAIPINGVVVDTTIFDVCSNIEGEQLEVPTGKVRSALGECVDRVSISLEITELLPNADGSDVGKEFIELYNPNDFAVQLADYVLYVGPQYDNSYPFPIDAVIEPRTYKSFSNTDIPFSLLNSSSRVSIALPDGTVINEVPAYHDPKDGQSWAFINQTWQYTTYPTPGLENIAAIDDSVVTVESTLMPCAANQYRRLETNRCRLISSSFAVVAPCKDGQYRSEETNRCRTISSEIKTVTACNEDQERNPETGRCRKIVAATTPAPCKEGQERNPDTNRCRTVAKMPSVDYGVLGSTTKNEGNWYVLAAIGGILVLALAYGVWEWRVEIGKLGRKGYAWMLRLVRIRK